MAVKVKWLGHAFFQITSQNGKIIYIDPWITENPSCSMKLSDFDRADVILVTHDHFDHVGQTVELSKQTGATVVAPVETAQSLKEQGVPESQIIFGGFGMNIGGTAEIDGIKLTMTQAFHSSATASPAGYIITTEDGKTFIMREIQEYSSP